MIQESWLTEVATRIRPGKPNIINGVATALNEEMLEKYQPEVKEYAKYPGYSTTYALASALGNRFINELTLKNLND